MLKLSDYVDYDGLGLADLVRRKLVTPAELLASAQAAMAAVDPTLRAVVYDMREAAAATLQTAVFQRFVRTGKFAFRLPLTPEAALRVGEASPECWC